MAAVPVDGRRGTGLTHVFHDETPGFARILNAFRQKGIPCLPLMYINDYLLQVKLKSSSENIYIRQLV